MYSVNSTVCAHFDYFQIRLVCVLHSCWRLSSIGASQSMATQRSSQNTLPSTMAPVGDESSSADSSSTSATTSGPQTQLFTSGSSYPSLPLFSNQMFLAPASAPASTPPVPLPPSCRCNEYRQTLHEARARLALMQQELYVVCSTTVLYTHWFHSSFSCRFL